MNLTPCHRCKEAAFDLHLTAYGLCEGCEKRLADDLSLARQRTYNLCEWELIAAGQRDRLLEVLDDPTKATTADRHPIKFGETLWDYDLNPCIVVGIADVSLDQRETNGAAIWWRTTTGMFDGTRLAYRNHHGKTATL